MTGIARPIAMGYHPMVLSWDSTVSQMRLNPLTGRWVTIVAERARRPSDFAPRAAEIDDPARPCPFCPGNEESTLPALETVDDGGSWRMRVIPNLYPAFDGDSGFVVHHLGPVHVTAEASGIHEVFVYTPDHDGGLDQLDDEQAAELMRAVQRRLAEHAASSEVRYTQVIINHGREAGASLAHPHAQILGLPFVPGEILDEERAFARFAGGCVICTTIEAELATGERVVFADDDVVCITPFWSGAPFELLLMPRRHELHLQDADPSASSRWAGPSATPSPTSRPPSATWPTTSASTPRRTSTRASTTGTSTCGPTWSPRPGSSGAPA